jgi:phospholipid/cholesterol/gamma-HCH transport system ATP-binding protein
MARAIALDPVMVMYDEPFTGQDPISMGVLVNLIRSMNQSLHLSSLVVSHDVQETLSIADYIYLISDGRVVGQGTTDELKNSPDAWVQQFIAGLPDGPVPFHYAASPVMQDLLQE